MHTTLSATDATRPASVNACRVCGAALRAVGLHGLLGRPWRRGTAVVQPALNQRWPAYGDDAGWHAPVPFNGGGIHMAPATLAMLHRCCRSGNEDATSAGTAGIAVCMDGCSELGHETGRIACVRADARLSEFAAEYAGCQRMRDATD